jgi:hypothetical protein
MTMSDHTHCRRNARSHRDIWLGTVRSSDFHVFLHLKIFLGGRWFHDDNEVKEAVNTWFASQTALFYGADIQKMAPRYKCLNNGGNYVEKQCKVCTSNGNINGL